MRTLLGFDWAQPVVRRRWAPVAVVLDWAKRATGYRLFVHASHRSWERAVGVFPG